jgi:hypothetical protein
LALQIVLLRFRLFAVRTLLRGVIALRFFIRRRRQRTAAGVHHARFGVDPWMPFLVGQRKGRLLPVFIIGAACALTGFMTGWQYERGNWASSPTADATELKQTKPAAPHVVVINSGTAEHQTSAQRASPSPRAADNDVSRPDYTHKKASDQRTSRARHPTQSYQDLRDYVLRR